MIGEIDNGNNDHYDDSDSGAIGDGDDGVNVWNNENIKEDVDQCTERV